MTLKHRILSSVLGSLLLCVGLGAGFALIMNRFETALNSGSSFVKQQKLASEAIATCFTELQYMAMRHLRDYDDKVGDAFVGKAENCTKSIRKEVTTGIITETEASDVVAIIRKFEREVLEISGQLRTASAAFMRVHDKILELAHSAPTKAKKTLDLRPLTDIGLLMSASAVGHKAIDRVAVADAIAVLKAQAKLGDAKLRAKTEDLLVDLDVVIGLWNDSMGHRESALMETGKAFARIPVSFSNNALVRMTQELSAPMGLVRNALYASIIFLPIILILGLILTAWVLRSWTHTMGLLKEMGKSIIEKTENSVALVTELENEAKAGHGDEVSVALGAMLQTFHELEDLKKSLESKVESRTKALKKTQSKLFESEKLASLGTLASGVAHELNNPLQVIGLTLECLSSDFNQEEREKYVSKCVSQVDRMSRIITQLRRVSHKSDGKEEWISIQTLCQNALVLIEGRMKEKTIELTCDITAGIELMCEPTQIESLISNLLTNAIDAVLLRKDPATAHLIEVKAQRVGKNLHLIVKDNGVGMSDETKKRIFEPFFTSKEVGKGTGLGLSLGHRIATDHQIDLSVESKLGVGSTFTLKLPEKRLRQTKLLQVA